MEKRKGSMLGKFGANHPRSKPVTQMEKTGEIINTFGSIREAARKTGVSFHGIGDVISGKQKTSGGFLWR